MCRWSASGSESSRAAPGFAAASDAQAAWLYSPSPPGAAVFRAPPDGQPRAIRLVLATTPRIEIAARKPRPVFPWAPWAPARVSPVPALSGPAAAGADAEAQSLALGCAELAPQRASGTHRLEFLLGRMHKHSLVADHSNTWPPGN